MEWLDTTDISPAHSSARIGTVETDALVEWKRNWFNICVRIKFTLVCVAYARYTIQPILITYYSGSNDPNTCKWIGRSYNTVASNHSTLSIILRKNEKFEYLDQINGVILLICYCEPNVLILGGIKKNLSNILDPQEPIDRKPLTSMQE